MKKILLPLLLITSGGVIAQKLEGAFKIKAAQYGDKSLSQQELSKQQVVKIFKNGYWIGAFFGDPKKPFSGTCGGTYKIENGKYLETVNFYSWDSTAVGDTYSFNYKLDNDTYVQDGRMDSEKYPNYIIKEEFTKFRTEVPLKNASMEGAWILQDATCLDKAGKETSVKNYEQIKIYCYPRFAYAQYNAQTKQFIGAGGGTYQYDGKKLTEHIEYTTYDNALGSDYEIEVENGASGNIQQLSQKGSFRETWKQLKQ